MKTEEVKQDGIEQALCMFRTTLERGYKFVLCVEAKIEASKSKLEMTQTNHTPVREAKMLAKFARQSAKRAKDGYA